MAVPTGLRRAGVTAREAEVLRALASRLTNAEIAERLFISVRTVESHVSALLRKLAATDRLALSELAREAFDQLDQVRDVPGALDDIRKGTPFVGRAPELDRLVGLFEEVHAAHRRRLAVITGEAGVGKTRLAAEVAAACHTRGARVIHGRCEVEALIAFQVFVEAIAPLVGGLLDPSEPLRALASTGADTSDRYALFEEVDRLIAGPQPVVFVLDDAQWADPSSLQLLRHVLRQTDRSSLLVVATARPDGVEPNHPLAATVAAIETAHPVELLPLAGLSLPDVEALSVQMAGTSQQQARDIWERAGGNPFLVTELLRHGLGNGGLATSARDAIVRRVAGLGPDAFEALTAAAVAGEAFDTDVVAAALGSEPSRHAAGLERAFGAGLIIEDQHRPDNYRFAHAIVRDALISLTRPSRRAALHIRIADVLAARGDESLLPEIARHRHAALPKGDPAEAGRAALAASEHAMHRLAYEIAASLADMALEALEAGGDESDRIPALLARGNAHLKAGDLPRASEDFRAALNLARNVADLQGQANAVLGWAATSVVWGRNPELRDALEDVSASGVGEPGLRARVHAKLAQVLYHEDAGGRRIELARAAVADARATGRPEVLAAVLDTSHAALHGPEDLEQRTAVAEEIVAVARRAGHLELEASGLGWLACDRLEHGDLRGADTALTRHRELADRLDQRLLRRDSTMWNAMRAILDGRFEDAAESIERARDLGEAAHDPATDTIYWVQRYWLACERAKLPEMDELVEPCERLAHANSDVPAWRAALAMLHARRHDPEAASRHFETLATDDFRGIPRDVVWLNAMTYLAETCAFLDDAERAPTLYRTLQPYADRIALIDRALACKGSVHRFLGLLATTSGDHAGAAGHLGQALERDQALDSRPLADRTRRDLAGLGS